MLLHVDRLCSADRGAIERLVAAYPYRASLGYGDAPRDRIADRLAGDLAKLSGDCEGRLLGVTTEAGLRGVAALEHLPWESTIFGERMAKIACAMAFGTGDEQETRTLYDALLNGVLSAAAELNLEHLACRVPAEETALANSLERAGFSLRDTTLEITWTTSRVDVEETPHSWVIRDWLRNPVTIHKVGVIRPVADADIPEMTKLAEEAFTERTRTRFAVDPALARDKTRRLYAEWFHNSCSGTFADVVRIAAAKNRPIGFLTLKVDKKVSDAVGTPTGIIGIGAVLSSQEGKGVMPSLLCAVLKWCRDNGVELVHGRMLVNNYSMQKCCLLTGGVITSAFHSFHKDVRVRADRGTEYPGPVGDGASHRPHEAQRCAPASASAGAASRDARPHSSAENG